MSRSPNLAISPGIIASCVSRLRCHSPGGSQKAPPTAESVV
jgi:hypothetical protein